MQDNTFDVVVCKAFLHHVPNPPQSIIEMHRVVKKNGVVAAFDEPNALNPFRQIARFLVLCLHFRRKKYASMSFLMKAQNLLCHIAFIDGSYRSASSKRIFNLLRVSVYGYPTSLIVGVL